MKARHCIALLAWLASSLGSTAQADTLSLHTATWHSAPGYEHNTPGVSYRWASGASLGVLRNSHGRTSALAAWSLTTDEAAPLSGAITVGVITGYAAAPLAPFVAPSIALRLTPSTALRAILLPRWHPKLGTTSVNLAIEVTL